MLSSLLRVSGQSVVLWCLAILCVEAEISRKNTASKFYSFDALDGHGRVVHMDKYRGKVLLVVNVASECGYTDGHYRDLVNMRDDLGKSGHFEVLAFPCNQFGGQEPRSMAEILHFVTENYRVNFPVFQKINVIDPDVPDLWKYLEESSGKVPTWNFWKYLVDSTGSVVNAWGPWKSINDIYDEVLTAVTAAEQTKVNRLRDHQDL